MTHNLEGCKLSLLYALVYPLKKAAIYFNLVNDSLTQ